MWHFWVSLKSTCFWLEFWKIKIKQCNKEKGTFGLLSVARVTQSGSFSFIASSVGSVRRLKRRQIRFYATWRTSALSSSKSRHLKELRRPPYELWPYFFCLSSTAFCPHFYCFLGHGAFQSMFVQSASSCHGVRGQFFFSFCFLGWSRIGLNDKYLIVKVECILEHWCHHLTLSFDSCHLQWKVQAQSFNDRHDINYS